MTLQSALLACAMSLAGLVARAQDAGTIPLASPALKKGAVADGCRPEKTAGVGRLVDWRVVKPADDKTSATIAEITRERVDPKYSMCVFEAIRAKDVDISVEITPLEGEIDRAGGLAARLIDADNYYVVRANALEDNVRLYRVIRGQRIQFAGASASMVSGRPQRLRLRIEGDRFTVEFNDKTLFEARDSTLTGPGSVALWTKADSLTEFSNLTVRQLGN